MSDAQFDRAVVAQPGVLSPYLLIGKVGRAHGVNGLMRIQAYTDDVSRFGGDMLPHVYTCIDGVYTRRKVVLSRVSPRQDVVLGLEGITNRDEAEALCGLYIYIDREHAVKREPDAHFICDLIGCEVYDDASGRIGVLRDVLQPGGNDVYEISTNAGTMLLPALKSVVTAVDVLARRIVVDRQRMNETSVML